MLTAVLSAMEVWNNVQPPYASAVLVELHKLDDGNHGVQVLYNQNINRGSTFLNNTITSCSIFTNMAERGASKES